MSYLRFKESQIISLSYYYLVDFSVLVNFKELWFSWFYLFIYFLNKGSTLETLCKSAA